MANLCVFIDEKRKLTPREGTATGSKLIGNLKKAADKNNKGARGGTFACLGNNNLTQISIKKAE